MPPKFLQQTLSKLENKRDSCQNRASVAAIAYCFSWKLIRGTKNRCSGGCRRNEGKEGHLEVEGIARGVGAMVPATSRFFEKVDFVKQDGKEPPSKLRWDWQHDDASVGQNQSSNRARRDTTLEYRAAMDQGERTKEREKEEGGGKAR